MPPPRRIPQRRPIQRRPDPFPAQLISDLRRFLQTNAQRSREPQASPEVFGHPILHPLQRANELTFMLRLLADVQPRSLLEIGTDKGGGLYHFCQTLNLKQVIGIDQRGCPFGQLFEQAFPKLQFHWVPRHSRATGVVNSVQQFLRGEPLDVLFLDGDELQFREDLEAYWPLLRKPGGVVFIHDIVNPAPRAAFEAYRKQARCYSVLLDTAESREALASQEAGKPAASAYEGWLRHWHGAGCGVGILLL